MSDIPISMQFYFKQVGVETEVVNKRVVVNEMTNEQFSVSTYPAKGDSSLNMVEVKRNQAPKKKAKNSQNC